MGLLSNFRHKFHNAFFTQVLYGTVASLAIFLTSWDHLDRMRDRLQSKLQNDTDTFDFIIVGAGTAGSVVAHRLSQYYSVLLLEAGGEPNPFQAVPGLALFMPNHPEIDWMHRSVPQKRAFGNSLKREASLSQGKGLGGSGNLNFLNYLRGSPMDYEHWKNITADPSWGYSEMRKYFQLVEDYTKEPSQKSRGAVKLDIPDYVGLSAEFITAGDQLGYKHVDLNDIFVEGFDVNYYPIYKGVRQAPYQSYLKPARGRKSLTIRKFSHVNKILFRDNSTQAYGVEYERHGELKIAKAAKEVIVSAGALSTPKILLLSGVGPSEHLQDIGIPLRLNLPVGRNLQDHISTLLGPFLIKEPRSLLVGKDIDSGSFLEWGMDGKGPLTSSFYQASALLLSDFAKSREEDQNWPDIHLQLSSVGVHKTYAQDLAHAYNLQENLLTQYFAHAAGKQSFSISITNGRPVGRGEVLLSGREVKDKLIINPKYLEDSYGLDVKILKDGVKTALRLAENTTAFQKIGARFTNKQLPGCEHVEFRSDAYWECYIRQFSISMHAYCGTAAMGKATSKYAVVDPELKVIGAKGLRVVDASVMPSIVVGSPQGAILAIAEKGANSILKYWRQFDVPSKLYDDDEDRGNATKNANDDFTDSFSGFAYLGKVTRVPKNDASTHSNRKFPKQKTTTSKPQQAGQPRHGNRVVVTTRTKTPTATAPTTTVVSTSPKKSNKSHKQEIFEQAETFFSHNLNQIMEFLRNSRAIDEKLDDDTYNDLVQNFGDRIADLMKKNKTDIFFIPVTTTTTESPTTLPNDKPSSTQSGQVPSSKNTFSSKYSERKPIASPTKKNGKPSQLSTTVKPITIVTQKLAAYHVNEKKVSEPKTKATPAPVSKNVSTSLPASSFTFSSSGKKIIDSLSKFSPLLSTGKSGPNVVTTVVPKKVTTSSKPVTTTSVATSKPTQMSIDTLFNNPASTDEEGEEEEEEEEETTTVTNNSENPVRKPMEITLQPSKKIVELILNPDLTVNKTKEIDSETFKSLTTSSVVSSSDASKKPERELIEYRTEEVRPFPNYPPYKIFSVPGQEFVPGGQRLLPPPPYHHPQSHQIISSISSPSILFQHNGIASLTPPPPQHTLIAPHHSLPSLHNFQQAQLLAPPKLPAVIDENLPIQTAKTVLYYTQVYPRDPNEVRSGHAINRASVDPVGVVGGEGRLVSSPLSLPAALQREDQRQNIVQFFPSIH